MNTELVAPAGNFEKLKTALHYGADAVYLGLSNYSLRAKAENFSQEELAHAIAFVHEKGKKAYVTINIFPHNRDLPGINEHIRALKELSPDAVIVSDAGVFEKISVTAPEIPIHISTQANITNYETARFWEKAGAKRLILSRELTIEEIGEIREHVSLELECFVHGALCISYSGRCYMSSFLANRSANRGLCTNSCRWSYTLTEEKRPGDYFPVYENERGTYVLSSKDLCMIEHLDKLREAGISSFKIEGRMKGINYIAGVTKTYRDAIDTLLSGEYMVNENWLKELSMFSSRGYTTGMFFGKQPDEDYNHDEPDVYRSSHELVGVVSAVNNGSAEITLRNNCKIGDKVQFLTPGFENYSFEITDISDMEGNRLSRARNEERVVIPVPEGVRIDDLIRRELKQPGETNN